MSKPTNLSRARKRKDREARARAADATRAREGQTKAERASLAKSEQQRARHLAGLRRVPTATSAGQQKEEEARGDLHRDPGPERE